jgi:hypothetical protein
MKDRRLFDADGNEVLVTLICTRCRQAKPFKAFGIRRMPDGGLRSISQCSPCRGARRHDATERKEWSLGAGGGA